MNAKILAILKEVTEEEQSILNGDKSIKKSLYTSENAFVIDRNKLLERGKLIDIRTHTRFVHFPQHRHNYIEIIYMCSGSTTHLINQKQKVVLEEGDLLFLNQNATQEIWPAKENDIAVNFVVLPEFFDKTFELLADENVVWDFFVGALQTTKSTTDYIHFRVADVLPIQNLIENMLWSLINHQANRRKINQMTMALLILQLTNHMDRIDRENPQQYEKNVMFSILQYIEENYKEGSLTQLAQLYKQSIPGMSRFIKKHSGLTFQQLMQQKRIQQAAFLLRSTKLTVEDIIVAVGYDNTSYFHRLFRERFDLTPKKYRDQNLQEQ